MGSVFRPKYVLFTCWESLVFRGMLSVSSRSVLPSRGWFWIVQDGGDKVIFTLCKTAWGCPLRGPGFRILART